MANVEFNRTGNIQAVVFDAVGTVMYPRPSVADAYRNAILEHCDADIPADVVQETVQIALQQRSAGRDLSTSEEAERDFWASLIRDLCPGSEGFQPCFDALFTHFGRPQSWRCFPDVAGLMEALTDRGLKVAIASNFDSRLNSVCDGLEALAAVECRIISSQVGFRKPAPEFFAAVVESVGVAAEHVLMVGDDLENDVNGATASGFQAAWVRRSASPETWVQDGVVTLNALPELLNLLPAPDPSLVNRRT